MLRCILAGLALTAAAAAPPQPAVLRPHATLRVEANWVDYLAFRHDGKLLATSAGGPLAAPYRNSGEIKIWDVASGNLQSTWKGNNANAVALAFTADGKILVSVKNDLEQVRRNMSTGKAERT